MLKNIDVRPARHSDVPALASVHADACISAYKFLPAAFIKDRYALANQLHYFQHILRHKNDQREIFVGMNDKKIVGFIDVGHSDQDYIGKIHSLFVDRESMGHGVGSFLLRHGERWLIARGYKYAILWVFSENLLAREFYGKAGWEDTNVEEPTSWTGLNEVMCRKLEKTLRIGRRWSTSESSGRRIQTYRKNSV